MVEYFVETALSKEENISKLERVLAKNEKIATSIGSALVAIIDIDKSFDKNGVLFAVINDIKASNSKKKDDKQEVNIYLKQFNLVPEGVSISELEQYAKERIFNAKMTDCNKQPFKSRYIPTCSFTDLYVKWPKINKINKFEEILTKFPCARKKVEDIFEEMASNSFGLKKNYSFDEERMNYLVKIEEYLKNNYKKIHGFIEEQAKDNKIEYVRLMFTTNELFMSEKEMNLIRNEKLLWMGDMLTKNGKILVGVNQNKNKPLICSFNINIHKDTINDVNLKEAYLLDLVYMFMKYFKTRTARKEIISSFELDEVHKEILVNKFCICGDGTSADLYEDYFETPSYRKNKDLKFIIEGNDNKYELTCFQFIDRFFYSREALGKDEESKEKMDKLIQLNKHFLEYCKNAPTITTPEAEKLYSLTKRMFDLFIDALKNNSELRNYRNAFLNRKSFMESLENELGKRGILMNENVVLNKLKDWKISKSTEQYKIESDDEYYFIAGQLIYYIETKKLGTHELMAESIVAYLNKKNDELFKDCLARRIQLYSHAIEMKRALFNSLMSAVLNYKPVTNINKNKVHFMNGVFSENIIYFKSTVTEKALEA